MANSGLLFIPDISGFSQFINETEIDHSRHIIRELLETLINSNHLQLQVSEIEGDAILFYRFGELPSLEEIYRQVSTMFRNFHSQLNRSNIRRICQCSACKKSDALTLKVITHHGEFSTYNIKEFSKLIGKDVISVHQLLKNDIPHHEYWLVTENLVQQANQQQLPQSLHWEKGGKQTENGSIDFFYTMLTPLKNEVKEAAQEKYGIKGKRVKVFSLERAYDVNIQKLFAVIGDIRHRPQWMADIQSVDRISEPVNQIGASHHCILNDNIEVMTTSDFHSDDYSITMEETDNKKMATCQFKLQKITKEKTLLTVNLFLKQNMLLVAMFKLFMKKKFTKKMQQSMENLASFSKTPEAGTCHC